MFPDIKHNALALNSQNTHKIIQLSNIPTFFFFYLSLETHSYLSFPSISKTTISYLTIYRPQNASPPNSHHLLFTHPPRLRRLPAPKPTHTTCFMHRIPLRRYRLHDHGPRLAPVGTNKPPLAHPPMRAVRKLLEKRPARR